VFFEVVEVYEEPPEFVLRDATAEVFDAQLELHVARVVVVLT